MTIHHDLVHMVIHKHRIQQLRAEAHQDRLAKLVQSSRRTKKSCRRRTTDDVIDGGIGTSAKTDLAGPLEHWHVTAEEIAADYPCDRLAQTAVRALTRGIDVDAPVPVTFRWLCQLRVAPYSYDWIDNAGRESPRTLTPGLDQLAKGQRLLIGELADFAMNAHITLRALPAAERWYRLVALTYLVTDRPAGNSRIVVRLLVHEPENHCQRVRFHLLAWADLIMMCKQLITLKQLAEESAPDLQPVLQ
jgi:hypothetical protein